MTRFVTGRFSLVLIAIIAAVSLFAGNASAQVIAQGTIDYTEYGGDFEATITWDDQTRGFNFCDWYPDDWSFSYYCPGYGFNFGGTSCSGGGHTCYDNWSPMHVTGSVSQTGGSPPSGGFVADFYSPPGTLRFSVLDGDGSFVCLSPPSVGLCGCAYLLPDGTCGAGVGYPWFATSVGTVNPMSPLPRYMVSDYGPGACPYPCEITYTIDGDDSVCGPAPTGGTQCTGTVVLNAFAARNTEVGGTPGDPNDNSTVQVNTSFYDPVNLVDVPVSVDIAYDSVTAEGRTTVTTSSAAAGDIDPNFKVTFDGYDAIFTDVSFEGGTYEGPVRVCSSYPDDNQDGIVDGTFNTSECDLRILHNAGAGFQDATMGLDEIRPERCPFSPPTLTVFVTEDRHSPGIGVAGADAFCQLEANAAGLEGTYQAWLSTRHPDNTHDPRDWGLAGIPYRFLRPDGAVIAGSWEQLVSGTLSVNIDRTGSGQALSLDGTVFVTEGLYPPNIGVSGADAACQSEAEAAGLAGIWRAWLSTDTYSPASSWEIDDTRFFYRTSAGYNYVAYWRSEIIGDGELRSTISYHADGTSAPVPTYPWTGTLADGTPSAFNCQGWTVISVDESALTGNAHVKDASWTDTGSVVACWGERPFYCFQQDEEKHLVWTGTSASGAGVFSGTCSDWSSQSDAAVGMVGDAFAANTSWTELRTLGCDRGKHHFYCFEEPDLSGPYSEPDDWCPNYEWDNDLGDWVLVGATCIDREANEICALVDALSPFVVAIDVGHITALDVAPTLSAVNTPVVATASVCDPDFGQFLIAEIDWGDGLLDTVETTSVECGQLISATHMYAEPGVYTVSMTVTDELGEFDSETFEYAVIYDPSGGFVTGGGWIDSPEGAYAADPDLSGKASFGFVSKYKKGASVPTGNTEFQFKVADLNFKSTSYDWLVIAGGTAKYKGEGAINGEGSYRFMLWGGDGTPDTFRIRIWTEDEATAVEMDVYDNGFGQDLGGGSVVIHKGK